MASKQTSQAARPVLRSGRRVSAVWVVPIVALLLGGWLVIRHFAEQGPVVKVGFRTADGIVKGKTEVRCRSVRVGVVEGLKLTEDLSAVTVYLRMDPEAAGLLRGESRFWVVRPRVSGGSVSGLGTIISGAYIELEPGTGPVVGKDAAFQGLEEPPVTAAGVPGLRVALLADRGDRAEVGAPVLFQGNEVGRIDRSVFDPALRKTRLQAFIDEEYAGLVTENTRFWIDNVLEVEAGAQGFKLKMPSLASLVAGGVTFGVPEGMEPGAPVRGGLSFELFNDQESAAESAFESAGEFLLLFNQSVRGLAEGAPVEFRGLQVGRVGSISFSHAQGQAGKQVPVIVELDKRRLENQFPLELRDEGGEGLMKAIKDGLRGSLKSGNLLTGQLFVDLDYFDDPQEYVVEARDGLLVLPTIESGFQQVETKLVAVLDKLEKLQVEGPLADIGEAAQEAGAALRNTEKTLMEAKDALAAIRSVVEDDEFMKLPGEIRTTLVDMQKALEGVGPDSRAYGDLRRTMDELRSAARSIERVADGIEEKPNSLIFGRGKGREAIPRAVRVNE